jgi:protein gp37
MNKSNIGYYTVGPDGGRSHIYYAWNPFGFGCSGCSLKDNGCWAQLAAKRATCPDCRAFLPHTHPSRFHQPGSRKQPTLILCNFTNDWMDTWRVPNRVANIFQACIHAGQHTYITLTKLPGPLSAWVKAWPHFGNMYHGLTIRNQAEADAKLPDFLQVPGNLWVSYEPAEGGVDWADWFLAYEDTGYDPECDYSNLQGIIVGHDNRRGAPGTDNLRGWRAL